MLKKNPNHTELLWEQVSGRRKLWERKLCVREGSDRGEMEDEALRESEAERGRETGEKNKAGQGNQTVRATAADWQAERGEQLINDCKQSTIKSKGCTCTFSFSPEYEGPKGGDYLKLVVAESPHLSDSTGQDHTFGVHLLKTDRNQKRTLN